MGLLTPFIVLIERRLLRPLVVLLLSSLALVSTLGVQAGGQGKHRKVAKDLEVAVAAPIAPAERWVRQRQGQRLVDAVIVGNGGDPEMRSVRADVERLGGTVHARFSSVQALSVTMPAKAIRAIDQRSDVESISPNRTTRRAASSLETVTGSTTSNVRPSVGTGYTGLDGSGIGIAVLDSGVMAAHEHMKNASGASRVARQVDLVGKASNALAASAMAPGSSARLAFEASINSSAEQWLATPR